MLGARRSDDAPVNSAAQAMIDFIVSQVISSDSDGATTKSAVSGWPCGKKNALAAAADAGDASSRLPRLLHQDLRSMTWNPAAVSTTGDSSPTASRNAATSLDAAARLRTEGGQEDREEFGHVRLVSTREEARAPVRRTNRRGARVNSSRATSGREILSLKNPCYMAWTSEELPATTTSGLTQHDVEPRRRLDHRRQLADGQPERGGFERALEVAALEGLQAAPVC